MALVSAVLLALLEPAYEHFQDLNEGLSPVLQISEGWRGAAVGVGAILLLLTALQTLARIADWRQIAVAVVLTALAWFALDRLGPSLAHMGHANLLVFFVLFVAVSMAMGMPIAFAFLLGTIA